MKDKDYNDDLNKNFPDAHLGMTVMVTGWAVGESTWVKTEKGWKREVRPSTDQ